MDENNMKLIFFCNSKEQPRPQSFSHFFKGKALGTRLSEEQMENLVMRYKFTFAEYVILIVCFFR